jgi:hypothetical protein
MEIVIEAIFSAAAFIIKAAVFFFGVRMGRILYIGEIKVRQYLECAFLAAIIALFSATIIGNGDYAPKPGQRTSDGIRFFMIAFTALAYGTSTRSKANRPQRRASSPCPMD